MGLRPLCDLRGCCNAQPMQPCKGLLDSGAHLRPVCPLMHRTIPHGWFNDKMVTIAVRNLRSDRRGLTKTHAAAGNRKRRSMMNVSVQPPHLEVRPAA